MSKYFYDTEFLEGKQGGVPTIDLISIGIVAEDGREYYAISNGFDLALSWSRNDGTNSEPNFWIRDNVLKLIYKDLCELQRKSSHRQYDQFTEEFNFNNLDWLLLQHGKSRDTIKTEILEFLKPKSYAPVELYGYYSAYDHVVLCWLFGRMIDLPKGMPMYTIDLKQDLDRIADLYLKINLKLPIVSSDWYADYAVDELKQHKDYPKQENAHNALSDARWNLELYKFLKTI